MSSRIKIKTELEINNDNLIAKAKLMLLYISKYKFISKGNSSHHLLRIINIQQKPAGVCSQADGEIIASV